ncbi:MAG: phosphotransferase [Gemmataceae bacterium]
MTPSDAEIVAALEPALGRVERLERRPYEYASSYALEAIDVAARGVTVPLVFKNVGSAALSPAGRAAKAGDPTDPGREIAAYRHLLGPRGLGTARCYAAVDDAAIGHHWLFLERVAGRELYQVGEFALWQAAARWLGRLHAGGPAEGCRAIRHDAAYYYRWPGRTVLSERAFAVLVEWLTSLPTTAIHGEFYASNVLVQDTPAGVRICPVDWETLGHGPGLIDLAALTAGRWTDAQRTAIAEAYLGTTQSSDLETLLVQLDWCRLHLALRWLDGPANWQAPPQQAFDWHNEVRRLAAKLGLE